MRTFSVENWGRAPYNRESFQKVQSLFPTARVSRGLGAPTALPSAQKDVVGMVYPTPVGAQKTIEQMLIDTYTDAFLVLKDGVLVSETYDSGMGPDSLHIIFSVTKSFLSMLAGILTENGVIDPNKRVSSYIPEFAENAFSETTVRQLLDMTAGVQFDENYANQESDFWRETSVLGWRPELVTTDSPRSLFEYAKTRAKKDADDGFKFQYRSLLTNVIAMVIEGATKKPVEALFEDLFWRKLGCEQDCAIVVDPVGFPYFGAGMLASARDLARFGLLLLNNGHYNGQQIVPQSWIRAAAEGTDDLRTLFAQMEGAEAFPGAHYCNQIWALADQGVFWCLGIHGQTIFINQQTNVVIVKLSSQPEAADVELIGDTFSGLFALSHAL